MCIQLPPQVNQFMSNESQLECSIHTDAKLMLLIVLKVIHSGANYSNMKVNLVMRDENLGLRFLLKDFNITSIRLADRRNRVNSSLSPAFVSKCLV